MMSASLGRRKSHLVPPPPKCSSNPFASWPSASGRFRNRSRSESTGTHPPDRVAGPPSSSHRPGLARTPRTRPPIVAASLRNFLRNRPAAAHTRAWEDQCYRPHPDCSPDSSRQYPIALPGISMRFRLLSDTDRPLFRSATGTLRPGWPHARLFSDLLSELLSELRFFDLAARRFASFPQSPPRCPSPTSPPRSLTPHSAVPFQCALPPREFRQAPGVVPPSPREPAPSRNACRQPPPAAHESLRATREASHSSAHARIPERAAVSDSQVPARRRMRPTPSHRTACPIASSCTSASRLYSSRLLPLSALHTEF